MMVSNGLKSAASSEIEELAMSPARKERLSDLRWSSSCFLEGDGEERVEGRRRTVIFVVGGARKERWVRMEVPSSPAPRTRIFVVIVVDAIIGFCEGR